MASFVSVYDKTIMMGVLYEKSRVVLGIIFIMLAIIVTAALLILNHLNFNILTHRTIKAEIIHSGDELVIVPYADNGKYKDKNSISVKLTDTKVYDKKANELTKDELRDGDIIRLTYQIVSPFNKSVRVKAKVIRIIDHNQLIEGYLAILSDFVQQYQVDYLDKERNICTINTTKWGGISEVDKEIILLQLQEKFKLNVIEGSLAKSASEKLKNNIYMSKGLIITITKFKYDEKVHKIIYDIKMHINGRSGSDRGYIDAIAQYDGLKWNIIAEQRWMN